MPIRGRGLGRGRLGLGSSRSAENRPDADIKPTNEPKIEPKVASENITEINHEIKTIPAEITVPAVSRLRGGLRGSLRGRGLGRGGLGRGGLGQRNMGQNSENNSTIINAELRIPSNNTPIGSLADTNNSKENEAKPDTSKPEISEPKISEPEISKPENTRPSLRGGLRGRGLGLRGRGSRGGLTRTAQVLPKITSTPENIIPSQKSVQTIQNPEKIDEELHPEDSASQVGGIIQKLEITTPVSITPIIEPIHETIQKLKQSTLDQNNNANSNEGTRSTTTVSSAKFETGGQHSTTTRTSNQENKSMTSESTKVDVYGKAGETVTICTNFVRLKAVTKESVIYQYAVDFSPKVDSPKLSTRLLYNNDTPEVFQDNVGKIYDSRSILYCSKNILPEGKDELKLTSSSREGVKYKITIKLAKQNGGKLSVESPRMVPVYNTILAKIQKEMKLIPIRDSYYNMAREKKIPMHGLCVWPGYTATIQEQVGGLMLMVDLSFKVLRNQNVLQIFSEIKKSSTNATFKTSSMRALIGQTILTRYNNKNYRIDDIDWDTNPLSTFTYGYGDNKREITFVEYFQEQYQLKIKDMKQPMLVNRPKKKTQRTAREGEGSTGIIYLVPELCNATGLTDAMRCDFKVMQELAKTTRVKPDVRNEELQKFLDDIHAQPYAKDAFGKWGLELGTGPATITGRNIHKEKILCGKGVEKAVNANADFGNIVTKSPMLDPVNLKDWVLFYEKKDEKKVKEFVSCYQKCARQLAQTVETPDLVKLESGKCDVMARGINDYLNSKNGKCQLVINMMASKREDKYNAMKKVCCIQNPVPSQCIISRTLPDDPKNNKFSSVTQKIALQINAKLGGSLWAIQIPIKKMMLVGIDVWHGATATSKRASVAGLVASYDSKYTKWYSRAIFQESAEHEISNKLKIAFVSALTHFVTQNAGLPEKIVIYRDGVSDGGIPEFRENELSAFRGAFKEFPNYNPDLCVVIVSKRINVRMYSMKGKTLDNPMPGTVMDQKVTKPYYQDFYLVSQYVRQGTVTPSHFIVLENGGLSADHIQKLSYKLTHMYYNWPGTVRVPAPCQYAHKLSALVGENIQAEPSADLADKLYYL